MHSPVRDKAHNQMDRKILLPHYAFILHILCKGLLQAEFNETLLPFQTVVCFMHYAVHSPSQSWWLVILSPPPFLPQFSASTQYGLY
jgi:tRNA(Phe) wybutosine-synthesizing methylase Tyw3